MAGVANKSIVINCQTYGSVTKKNRVINCQTNVVIDTTFID